MTSNFNKLSVSQIRNNVTDPFYFSDDLVIAYINPSSVPVRATQLDGFVALIMMQGTAYITLGSGTYELKPNMMMYIHNDSVLHKVECSSDAGAYLVAFSQKFISDVPVDISTSLPVYLRFGKSPCIDLTETDVAEIRQLFGLIKTMLRSDKELHKANIIHTLFTTAFYILSDINQRRDIHTNQSLFTDELSQEISIEQNDVIDTTLLQEAQVAIAKLLDMGYSKETIWALLVPMQELSPIHVTKDYRIILPLYRKEIKLPPIQHAIYLLFLKHPEGIYFKNLSDYEEELYFLYRKLAFRGANVRHIQTIKDLVNPLNNSMNEKCSNIKKRVLAILDDSLAKHYYISGGKGN